MPKYNEHAKVGTITGMIAGFVSAIQHAQESNGIGLADFTLHIGFGAFSGLLGGIAPDIIEPATHPHHRGLFHSSVALTASGYGAVSSQKENADPYIRTIFSAFSTGYASHLVMDSQTPKSIPFLL
jgi:inner membrane protein